MNPETEPGLLFKDENQIAVLPLKPATPGHIQLFSAQPFTILEQVPNAVIETMAITANKLSTVLFDHLNCQGTNIIIENGIPAGQTSSRFSMHIIPRRENDGLNFQWNPLKLSEDDLNTIFLRLEEFTNQIIIQKEKSKIIQQEEKKTVLEYNQENYLLKQLRRMP
ncbi:HIT family protein [Candidatus Woesearchaeota archaeon]|nr:MAG: HIT family protein [Candidatus Woesearchaeota archaeon]